MSREEKPYEGPDRVKVDGKWLPVEYVDRDDEMEVRINRIETERDETTTVTLDGLELRHWKGGQRQANITPSPIRVDVPIPGDVSKRLGKNLLADPICLCAVIAGVAWESIDASMNQYERKAPHPEGDRVYAAIREIARGLKEDTFDTYWLIFKRRYKRAFSTSRTIAESWLHIRLLSHFGEKAAGLYLDDLERTARSMGYAETTDELLRRSGRDPGSRGLVAAVKIAREALDPDRRKWGRGTYWWLENTNAKIRSFQDAFKWILNNDAPLPHKSAEENALYVQLLKGLTEYGHLYVHPDPRRSVFSDRDRMFEANLVMLGINEIGMNVREIVAERYKEPGIHIEYANALRALLPDIGEFPKEEG